MRFSYFLLHFFRVQKFGIWFSLLSNPVFMLFSLAYSIGCPAVYGQWTYLPSLALESGLTKNDASALMVAHSAIGPVGAYNIMILRGDL